MAGRKAVGRPLLGAALAAALAFFTPPGSVRAQDASEPAAGDKGPKTLLEPILGRKAADDEGSAEEDRLDPDRPHFPEAATTVGKGRVMLEAGYTFTDKDSTFLSHSLPEALLRIGMFAEWFEFRIGQNFLVQQQTVAGMTTHAAGPQDLYLGVKLALTEQRGWLPEIALIPQMTVPTGDRSLTAGQVLPGVNVDMNWDVIKNLFGIELLIANNLVQDDMRQVHHELATGLTGVFQLTRQLEGFVEWDAFYPSGGSDGTRHYAVGGFVYFITPNLEVDIRAGVGLNHRANDVLAGVGFAVRR